MSYLRDKIYVKEVLLVLYLLLYFINAQSQDCLRVDHLERQSCPSEGAQHRSKSVCENDGCCWNSTWVNLPNCFYSYNASPTMTTAVTTRFIVTSQVSTRPGLETTLSPEEARQQINEVVDAASNANPNELSDIAARSLSETTPCDDGEAIVKNILEAADNIYTVQANDDERPNINDWLDFYDNIVRFPDMKTEENAEIFLNSSTTTLINEITTDSSSSTDGVAVVNRLEEYAIAMSTALLGNNQQTSVLNLKNAIVTSCRESEDESVCDITNDDVTASILTPNNRAYVTSITYNPNLNLHLLPDDHYRSFHARMGSSLFTVTSHDGESSIEDTTVDITFRKLDNPDDEQAICAFIMAPTGDWDDFGCNITSQSVTNITCSCNHNTSFALLFLHADIELTTAEKKNFEVITYIGCGTSVTALMLTVFSFLYLRLTRIKRIILHLNLALTLCLAQIILLIGTNVEVGTAQCKAVAVLLHFFFMSSFSWMLMEGILLYFQSVRAVKGEVNFNLMLVFGWVLPLVVVGTSLAAGYDGYGSDRGCWLSINNGLIWAFVGPALGFILINIVLLGSIVQVFLNLKSNAKTGEWEKAKRTMRAIALLTPLFGITWLFGALAVNAETKWFLYLFSICNSLQGIAIFLLHCLHNHDVRKAFMKKYKRNFQNNLPFFSSVTPSSSGTTYVNTTSGSMSTPSMPHKSWK